MEDYPDEFLANPSELCGDPLFSEVLKPKEDIRLISNTDTEVLVSSADETANSSITLDNEGQANLEQDAGDYEVSNHGNHLFESGELVPPALISVSGTSGLDRDSNGTASSTSNDGPQPSEMASVHLSPNGIAINGVGNLVPSGLSEVYAGNEDVISEVETVGNQGPESRALFCPSGSATSGAFDLPTLPNSAGGDTSPELIHIRSELPVFNRERDVAPESVVEVDVVSVASSPLSSLATDTTGREARMIGRRSLWDAFSGNVSRDDNDNYTSAIIISTDEDYQAFQERWLFDHGDLFSDGGFQSDTRYHGSRIQRSSDWRRRRRFEVII